MGWEANESVGYCCLLCAGAAVGNGQNEFCSENRHQSVSFPGLGAGREKTLASAGHVSTLHPEILGVIFKLAS